MNGLVDVGPVLGDRLASPVVSGYVAPSGRLAVFYAVAPPVTWEAPGDVIEVPAGPALGFLVRRP